MRKDRYLEFDTARHIMYRHYDRPVGAVYFKGELIVDVKRIKRIGAHAFLKEKLGDEYDPLSIVIAPTQNEVLDWMRKEKNCSVRVGNIFGNKKRWFYEIVYEGVNEVTILSRKVFSSYYEACENAIEYCADTVLKDSSI